MGQRVQIINSFYNQVDEDVRLNQSRYGQLEYMTTMEYVHRFIHSGAKILEIGAGTGRYSIALAKEGYEVTAVELVEHNLNKLKENSSDLKTIQAFQGDALNLDRFEDGTFDSTLLFGPMYHLYQTEHVHKALDEAIRVTKENGVILIAFLSAYAILFNNYLDGNLIAGLDANFAGNKVQHFEEQLFTGYDIVEFEQLFEGKNVEHLVTVAADGILELAERRSDFVMSEEELEAFSRYHLTICEKRELLGSSSHLLYICKKK